MSTIPLLSTTLLEATTGLLTFTLVDSDGAGVPVSMLTTLTLTYYDVISGTIVNSRNVQNVLNTNDVSITTVGSPAVTTVEWQIQPADTPMVNPDLAVEYRVAQFRWTWDSGARHDAYQVQFAVENMAFVV
jgi:hypothetical protein